MFYILIKILIPLLHKKKDNLKSNNYQRSSFNCWFPPPPSMHFFVYFPTDPVEIMEELGSSFVGNLVHKITFFNNKFLNIYKKRKS